MPSPDSRQQADVKIVDVFVFERDVRQRNFYCITTGSNVHIVVLIWRSSLRYSAYLCALCVKVEVLDTENTEIRGGRRELITPDRLGC